MLTKDSNKKLYDDEVIEGKLEIKSQYKTRRSSIYYNLVEEPKRCRDYIKKTKL